MIGNLLHQHICKKENSLEQQEFLDTLVKQECDVDKIFHDFYEKVIATNKMIGLCDDLNNTRDSLIATYSKLLKDEVAEVKEALESQDASNFVKEVIDVLVVGGFLHYLENESNPIKDCHAAPKSCRSLDSLLTRVFKEGELADYTLLYAESVLAKLNINLSLALSEVLNENLSKFPLADGCDIEEEIKRLEADGRYSGVYAEKVVDFDDHERIVFWCSEEYGVEKRKYLKGSSYTKSNMSKVWLN